jgi:hypothetical protein
MHHRKRKRGESNKAPLMRLLYSVKLVLKRCLSAILFLLLLIPSSALANERIIGGKPVAPGQFSWMAALVDKRENSYWGQFCGGSLIHPRWVLTSDSCIEDYDAEEIDVVLARNDLRKRNGERIAVASIRRNAGGTDGLSDTALLYLARKSKTKPVNLAKEDHQLSDRATVLGWGAKRKVHPARLQKGRIDFLSHELCSSAHEWEYSAELMYCAGGKGLLVDSCWEDLGGPLLYKGSLLAVISWKYDCINPSLPGVYSKIIPIQEWINYHIEHPPEKASIKPGKDHKRKPKPWVSIYFFSIKDADPEPGSIDNQYLLFVESNYKIKKSVFYLGGKRKAFFCYEEGSCVVGNRWLKQKRGFGLRYAITNFTTSNEQCPSIRLRVHIQNRKKKLWRWKDPDAADCGSDKSTSLKKERLSLKD